MLPSRTAVALERMRGWQHQLRAQRGMHRLRLLGRSGFACADGQTRLVRPPPGALTFGPTTANRRGQLALHQRRRFHRLQRSCKVSPTQTIGVMPAASAAWALAATDGVGFAVVLAALGVAHQGVTHARSHSALRGRPSPVKGAGWACCETSCAPRAMAEPAVALLHLCQIGRRHGHRYLAGRGTASAETRPGCQSARPDWQPGLPFIFQLPLSIFVAFSAYSKTKNEQR